MSEVLVPSAAATSAVTDKGADVVLPALIVDAGPDAVARFLEFFAGRIANARTRAGVRAGRGAVSRVVRGPRPRPSRRFPRSTSPPTSGPTPDRSRPSSSTLPRSACLCDGLVVSQVLPVNAAVAVRGPKHVVTEGSTPVLAPGAALPKSQVEECAGPSAEGAARADAVDVACGLEAGRRRGHPEAGAVCVVARAGSGRRRLPELFTVNRLGLPQSLRRCLTTTNIIDSSHAGVRQHTDRG